MPFFCNNCGIKLSKKTISGLCHKCLVNKNRNDLINNWLKTGDTNCGVTTTLRNAIRDYIFDSQDGKCAICGISNEWNGKTLNFILDHIDGNATNNFKDNLRLICPNCDSQLPTYKSRNKHSARDYRRLGYYERERFSASKVVCRKMENRVPFR